MNLVIKMLVTLGIIGVLSGGLLSEIASWAAPHIEHHRIEATKEAIFTVQPNAKDYKKVESTEVEAYQVFNDNSEPVGFAMVYEGSGFQGKIRLMVGLDNDLNVLSGLQILEQVETPGLGTKILEEPFLKQFEGLTSVPQIDSYKGEKENPKPNEIAAITGATISSKSVVLIINDGLKKLRELKDGGKL